MIIGNREIHPVAIFVAVLVIAVAVFALCFRPPSPKPIPPKDQHTLDSLAITKPTFDSSIQASVQRETVYVRRVDTLRTTIVRLERKTDTLRVRADTLAAAAHDSGSWHAAYTARTLEADTLRTVVVHLDSALGIEHLARLDADQRGVGLQNRLTVAEGLNQRLAADVKKAAECRVLWMRCPSRTRVAVVSGVLAASLTAAATKSHW
jgi:hypothetical protein